MTVEKRAWPQARTCKIFVDLFLQVARDFETLESGERPPDGGGEADKAALSLTDFPWLAVHGTRDGVRTCRAPVIARPRLFFVSALFVCSL